MNSVDCLGLQPFTILDQLKLRDIMNTIKIDLHQLLDPQLHSQFIEEYSNQRFAICLQKVKWHLQDKQFYVWLTLQYCFKHYRESSFPSYQAVSEIGQKMHLKESTLVKKWINLLKSQAKLHEWTQEEEQIVLSLQNQPQYKNNWTSISMHLGQLGYRLLHPKDIRERWNNYIDPKIHKDEWHLEEDYSLIQNVKMIGLCWSQLSLKIKGRNENQIKNRYHQLLKKYRTVKKCSEKVSELYNKQLLIIKGQSKNQYSEVSNQLEQEGGQNQPEPPDLSTFQILNTYPYLEEQEFSPFYPKDASVNEQLSNISNNEQYNNFAKLKKRRVRDLTSTFEMQESINSNNHQNSSSHHQFNQSIDQQIEVILYSNQLCQNQFYQYLEDEEAHINSLENVNQISPMYPLDPCMDV